MDIPEPFEQAASFTRWQEELGECTEEGRDSVLPDLQPATHVRLSPLGGWRLADHRRPDAGTLIHRNRDDVRKSN